VDLDSGAREEGNGLRAGASEAHQGAAAS